MTKDLDPAAEKFIVSWSQDLPTHGPRTLLVHLGRAPNEPEEALILKEAVHANFSRSAEFCRRRKPSSDGIVCIRKSPRAARVSQSASMALDRSWQRPTMCAPILS